jgi:pilus assembly protein CpaB
VRLSTLIMIGFAAVFGVLAVFLAQVWLNNAADQRLKSIEAQRKAAPAARTVVVAAKPLRFGDELSASSLREVAWPDDALPAGAFPKIADLLVGKRIALAAIDPNEAILKNKITGPGQRATLSAMLDEGMKAVTVRVNDVDGVAGFVLPGDHVDVLLTRTDKGNSLTDVVTQNVRVLAIDQLADERADKPSVVKAVTLEVSVVDGEKLALAATAGTLSLLLRKAGEMTDQASQRVTLLDIGRPVVAAQDSRFVNIEVNRPAKQEHIEYSVPVENAAPHAAVLPAGADRQLGTELGTGAEPVRKQAGLNRRGE